MLGLERLVDPVAVRRVVGLAGVREAASTQFGILCINTSDSVLRQLTD